MQAGTRAQSVGRGVRPRWKPAGAPVSPAGTLRAQSVPRRLRQPLTPPSTLLCPRFPGVSGARGASGKEGVGSRWWGSGRPGGWGPCLCPEVGGSSSGLREGLQGPPSRSRNDLDSFPQDMIRNVSSKHNDNHTVCFWSKASGFVWDFFFFFLISKAIGFCLRAMESGHQSWNCRTNIY